MGGPNPCTSCGPILDTRLCDVVMKAMSPDWTRALSKRARAAEGIVVGSPRSPATCCAPIGPPSNVSGRLALPLAPKPAPGSIPTALEAGSSGALAIGSELDLSIESTDVAPQTWQRRKVLTGAALVVAILSVGIWLGIQRARPRDAQPPLATPATEPAVVATPEAASVALEMFGVPQGAVITLDDRAVMGTRFHLAKDDLKHTLRVTADGNERGRPPSSPAAIFAST